MFPCQLSKLRAIRVLLFTLKILPNYAKINEMLDYHKTNSIIIYLRYANPVIRARNDLLPPLTVN